MPTRSDLRSSVAAALRSAIAATLCLIATACAAPAPVASFPWYDESGTTLAFRQAAGWEAGSEGKFGGKRATNRFSLEKPMGLDLGRALEFLVALPEGGGPRRILVTALGTGRKAPKIQEAEFPIADRESRIVLALEPGTALGAVEVSVPGEPAEGHAEIREIRFTRAFKGIDRSGKTLRVSSGFSLAMANGRQELSIERPFAGMAGGGSRRPCIVLEYGASRAAGPAQIRISGSAEPKKRELKLRSTGVRTALGPEFVPLETTRIEISLPRAVPLRAFYSEEVEEGEAELADLGRVLGSSPPVGDPDFSLYRWDLLPSVLVFDFRDYATQDRYLKRLAFFAEKAGFRGRLASDEEIAELHGWNAHDYRPEDLAGFFEAARKRGFPLNSEERSLGALLMERGVLARDGEIVAPGKGSIISIARESNPYQRSALLVHESTHAIYFADAEYRVFVRERWSEVDRDERWLWKQWFDWNKYDTASEYLMANEFQAYLLQQPLARATEYFTKAVPERLLDKHPERKAPIEAYVARFGSKFEERAARLDAWLNERYGIGAGKTYCLY